MYTRILSAIILAAYSAFLIKWMVFKDVPLVRVGQIMLNFGGTDAGHAPNFVPFATILPYLMGHKGLIIAGINLVGNIILLVPLGFLVPLVWQTISWKQSLALAIASGLVIETLQTVLHVGIFDIDDVILNALGYMIGYFVFVLLAKMARSMTAKSLFIAAVLGVALVATAGWYVYQKFPLRLEPAVISQSDRLPDGGEEDLCGGTGGNGQIVSVGDTSFVMERSSGGTQTVHLIDDATIRTTTGAPLQAGDRVTLVGGPNPDGSFTAEAVFVCSTPQAQ